MKDTRHKKKEGETNRETKEPKARHEKRGKERKRDKLKERSW